MVRQSPVGALDMPPRRGRRREERGSGATGASLRCRLRSPAAPLALLLICTAPAQAFQAAVAPRRPAGSAGMGIQAMVAQAPVGAKRDVTLSAWTVLRGIFDSKCRSWHDFMLHIRGAHGDVVRINLQARHDPTPPEMMIARTGGVDPLRPDSQLDLPPHASRGSPLCIWFGSRYSRPST